MWLLDMRIPTSVFTAMKLTAKNALDTASGWTLKKWNNSFLSE